jgi:predicted phage terminase large subunit-like protein
MSSLPTLNPEILSQMPALIRQEQRRRERIRGTSGLIPFVQKVKPEYQADTFHFRLAEILEQFLSDVIAGKQPRVMIFAPPQHGKSELVSRKFPAFALGKYPDLNIMGCSYSSGWADALSTDVQRTMEGEAYRFLFPETVIARYNERSDLIRRSDYFDVRNLKQDQEGRKQPNGSYKSAGVTAGISGRPVDIGIIDDPIAGVQEALSPTTRESLLNWYRQEFSTRLQEKSGVLLMMTRWHQDDLAGTLIEEMKRNEGEAWNVHNFPALPEVATDWRQAGEPLAPGRFSRETLERRKKVLGVAYEAMYQGNPTPLAGNIFNPSWWKLYVEAPQFEILVMSVDCTFKAKASSDMVAIQVWGFVGIKAYLVYRSTEIRSYVGTKQAIRETVMKYPEVTHILIEDKANGSAVIEELSAEISGVLAVEPDGGKEARAWACSGDVQSGNVLLPQNQPWTSELMKISAEFPATRYDDDVDAMTQALNWKRMRRKKNPVPRFGRA